MRVQRPAHRATRWIASRTSLLTLREIAVLAFGKSKRVQQILRLRVGGGEYVDIVWNGDPEGNETFADLLLIYRNGAGGTVEATPSGARIFVNWATVSTVHIVE